MLSIRKGKNYECKLMDGNVESSEMNDIGNEQL